MLKQEILQQYNNDVKSLRKRAKDLGLSEIQIENVFRKSFSDIKLETCCSTNNNPNHNKEEAQKSLCLLYRCKLLLFVVFIFTIIYVLLSVNQTTSSIVLRNVQGLTYPALWMLRILSVPVIKALPFLTDLYDETCIIENPYFYVSDMECWPCENVYSVINLTGINDKHTFKQTGSGTPFIIKTDQVVTFSNLQKLYEDHLGIFELESRRLKSTESNVKNLKDLFTGNFQSVSSKLHTQWRINKMSTAQVLRKLFPRPFFISSRSGQSVERFIMIDGPQADPYMLPNTECGNVFMIQGSGERTIVLKPSRECSMKCKTVSVKLKASYVLWYNWWYWRPISLPAENATAQSISYINSYC